MIIDGFLILVYAMVFYYYKHLVDLHFKNKTVNNKKEIPPKQESITVANESLIYIDREQEV